jgi:hypothetical protein
VKALTIRQPWASLIVAGAKPFEFRTWRPHASVIGQRIAIHAGLGRVSKTEAARLFVNLRDGNPATCLAEATLTDAALPILARAWEPNGEPLPAGAVVGTVIIGSPQTGADVAAEYCMPFDDRPGHPECWAWPLLDVQRWPLPVPWKGNQGLWHIPTIRSAA